MTEQNQRDTAARQNPGGHIKQIVRRILLVLLALPALIAGALLLLPTILQDPTLTNSDEQQQRGFIILAASLVAMYVVHRLTRTWPLKAAADQNSKAEANNGN